MLIEKEEIDKLYDKHMGDEGMAATLKDMIEKPNRYVGIFRFTNIATKVIQSSLQSREIKFGYFIEELTTEYIKALGYNTSLKKHYSAEEIGEIGDNNGIEYDHFFRTAIRCMSWSKRSETIMTARREADSLRILWRR